MYIFSILDLFPYFVITLLLLCFMVSNESPKSKALACFILMFSFSAIRYGIGYDYYGYLKMVLHEVDEFSMDRNEPLSRVLIEIGYYTHYQVFFAIAAFLTLFPIYHVSLKLSVFPAFALVIYFLFPKYYLESFSIVRNAIAFSMVFYAYYFLYKGNRLLSVSLIVIAFLFHKSALVGFLIYPVYYIRQYLNINIIAYVVSFFVSLLVMKVVSRYSEAIPILMNIENYSEEGRSGGGTMTIIVNFLNILNFCFWKKLESMDSNNSKYLTLFNVGTIFWNIFLSVDSTIALRLSSYFHTFIILLIPQFTYAVKEKYSKLVFCCSCLFFVTLFVSSFVINISSYLKQPDRMSNIPYQTVFDHHDYDNYVY